MIEYFVTLCLIGLLLTQGMLIRGCFQLPGKLHPQTAELRANIGDDFALLHQSVNGGVTLMDELIQMLADNIPNPKESMPALNNPLLSILTQFMGRTDMTQDDGSKTQEWEIHPPSTDENPQAEAED
jgi:hypothetical protein